MSKPLDATRDGFAQNPGLVFRVDPDPDPFDHPEVVKLMGNGSGVVIGPEVVLTAAHALGNVVGAEVRGGPNESLVRIGQVVKVVSTEATFDLGLVRVNWSADQQPRCIRPVVTSLLIGDRVRLVACGKPDNERRAAATGEVLHPKCRKGDPEEEAKWGGFHEETWIAQLTVGNICHLDSGGAAYSIDSGERVLVGVISGPVTGTMQQAVPVDGNLCSARERLILLNRRTIDWINQFVGNELCP